jgi:iron-siderophore transport system substrate-binding protein
MAKINDVLEIAMFLSSLRVALLPVFLLASAALAEPVSFETAGGSIELSTTPQKIIALDVAAIDTLAALGVKPSGIVAPLYVDYLDDAIASSTVVGTLFEPDFEKIAALQPDLIVVGGRSVAQIKPLSGIAPVADMSIGPDAVADGLARLAAYGALTNSQDKAAALADELTSKVEKAKALVSAQGDALILMTNGPKLSVFGAQSRFGWLHSTLGWPQAVQDIKASRHGEAVNFEYLAEANPDTLIVIDRGQAVGGGAQGAASTLDNELVHGTTAWKTGRIIYVSPAEIYVAAGGVQALNRTLDLLIASLEKAS